MCTVVLSTGQRPDWPLLLAANRDEMLDRPWLPAACHWPDSPDVLAGRDVLGGGTWLGVNCAGVVAAVLNRAGSLGPAPGKRSRGELPLLALAQPTAQAAAHAVAALDAGQWRSFNLVVADRDGAWFLRGTGQGSITAQAFRPGLHMVTAHDPDDTASPRVAHYLPLFQGVRLPDPPDWSLWTGLLADKTAPAPAAINITARAGFGTVSSSLVGLGKTVVFYTANGAPGSVAYNPVRLPRDRLPGHPIPRDR